MVVEAIDAASTSLFPTPVKQGRSGRVFTLNNHWVWQSGPGQVNLLDNTGRHFQSLHAEAKHCRKVFLNSAASKFLD